MTSDLNDVLVFIKVVELRSFTAAGDALGLPNSSISRKVTRLEDRLGVRLLHRTTRKLSLSDNGQLYYERAVRLIAGLEEAENILADTCATPRGRVKLIAPPEHAISMKIVNDFLSIYPEVRVDVHLTSAPVNIIHEGVDVAIVAGCANNLSVTAHKILDSKFILVASPEYLRKRGTPKTLSDLSTHDCVIFGRSSSNQIWNLQDGTESVKVPVHGRVASNHLQAIFSSVVADHGIALVPELLCGKLLASGQIIQVLKSAEPPPTPLFVTYENGKLLAPAVRALVKHIKENFKEEALNQ